jgi:selenocysteine lyase/cysteine desulfurase
MGALDVDQIRKHFPAMQRDFGGQPALTVMERLGLEDSGGAVRIGFCHYHTADEVERVLDAL